MCWKRASEVRKEGYSKLRGHGMVAIGRGEGKLLHQPAATTPLYTQRSSRKCWSSGVRMVRS